MNARKRKNGFHKNLAMLDHLAARFYKEMLHTMRGRVKIGDFMKIVEFRRKLVPGESAQTRFWEMLERIRQEHLSRKRRPRRPARTTRSATKQHRKHPTGTARR